MELLTARFSRGQSKIH